MVDNQYLQDHQSKMSLSYLDVIEALSNPIRQPQVGGAAAVPGRNLHSPLASPASPHFLGQTTPLLSGLDFCLHEEQTVHPGCGTCRLTVVALPPVPELCPWTPAAPPCLPPEPAPSLLHAWVAGPSVPQGPSLDTAAVTRQCPCLWGPRAIRLSQPIQRPHGPNFSVSTPLSKLPKGRSQLLASTLSPPAAAQGQIKGQPLSLV